MTEPTGVVDATATEVGADLERVEQQHATTLFRTDDPVEVVERASRVADSLKSVLDRQGLTAQISGKRHVLVEGWTTLGAMLGVTAVPVWTRALDGEATQGRTFGFEARVEARALDGRVIGAAEAMCTRAEGRWKTADDYAIRSMAQTRATSKALRGPLGFVVTLAGYAATPAEEMPSEPAGDVPSDIDPQPPAKCTPEQYQAILTLFAQAQRNGLTFDAWLAHLDEIGAPKSDVVGERVSRLSADVADELRGWLEGYGEKAAA